MFIDEKFDIANAISLSILQSRDERRPNVGCCESPTNVVWKRPDELFQKPCLRSECSSKPVQGTLGDCWLVAGCFHLGKFPHLLKRIFGDSPDFDDKAYCGKWNINLYDTNSNEWINVTIDDQLPTVNNSLLFGSCCVKNQLWFPLLEKACAKLYGSYAALNYGQISEAFMLTTGGFCWRHIPFNAAPLSIDLLTQQLTKATSNHDGMVVALSISKENYLAQIENNCFGDEITSLLTNHYYVVDHIEEVFKDSSKKSINIFLVDLSNSAMLTIPLEAVCFPRVTITYCSYDLQCAFENNSKFYIKNILSTWQAGINSGGRLGSHSYSTNPQYLITFSQCNSNVFYVNLIQENRRGFTKYKESEQALAVHMWKLSTPIKKPLSALSIKTNPADYVSKPTYQYKSDVSLFGTASHSKYLVLVPSTYSHNINCAFHLRFCALAPFQVEKLLDCSNTQQDLPT